MAVGWHGDHCFECGPCRRGDFVNCDRERITGIHTDGGYAEYTTAPAAALVAVPDGMDLIEAGPLACAGLTAFTALDSSDLGPGDSVAVQGIGGVGHMGLQFADAFGAETIALSRGKGKREAALELGADVYVDTDDTDPADGRSALGDVDTVFATAPASDAIAATLGGLKPNGEIVVVGAPSEPLAVDVAPVLGSRLTIRGRSAGHPGDARRAFEAAPRNGVEPRVETYALVQAEAAFERMLAGDARFRVVLRP